MWVEFLLIFIFILLNGFFAGAEIAVVTARKTRISQLVESGNRNAQILSKLQQEPDRFLATVQIGVTVLGALASAIGGAAAVEIIKPVLKEIPVRAISVSSEAIAIGLVVAAISYLSLIFGELVPKSIALMNPERVGLWVAKPIYALSKISSVFVSILTTSTNIILRPFGRKAFTQRAYISEEEIKLLIREGKDRGIFEPAEQELIHSIFEFTDISVNEVMVPVSKMVAIDMTRPTEEIISMIAEDRFSRYPVYVKDYNDIRGILYEKDIFNIMAMQRVVDIRKILHPPLFIPETMKISRLLREMQRKRVHMAIVIDEYGSVSGLVTIEDLLEEIVGEIRDEYDIESPVIRLKDGTLLVDASISIRDLKEDYAVEIPESPEYETLGGFVITTLQKIPETGDIIELEDKRLRVIEMVGRRVSKVKVEFILERGMFEA